MSNFWGLSDGKQAEQKSSFDASASEVIPDNTDALAVIEEAGWKAAFDHGDPDVIQLRWSILAPAQYKGRKIFHKLKVNDAKAKTSDKAKRMLMAIDTNAGGKLCQLEGEPSDNELMAALMNKTMVIKIKVWDMNDRQGNWVAAVSPAKKGGEAKPAAKPAETTAPTDSPFDGVDGPEGNISF